jgi:N-acetylglucosamine-6-phosphate deacetylase
MASITPARIMGVDSKMGSLEAEKDANIVIADDNVDVHIAIVEGKKAFQSGLE